MGTYKVIQDIEAEDKFVGPLTLRQFIFAFVGVGIGYICFLTLQKGIWLVSLFLSPLLVFCIFFAWPFGKDQPTEVWALAKLRFLFKPRKRIWDQSGMKELVTITVPKKVEHALTNGLSQTEVKSRLHALANTLDSRGWAVKNVNVNLSSQPSYLNTISADSDRLVDASSLPQEVPTYEVLATDDMLDEKNNLTAQHLDSMITQSEQSHRQALMATVQGKAPTSAQPADYWFMNQPDPATIPAGLATFSGNPTVVPGAVVTNPVADNGADEQALLEQIHKDQARPDPGQGHMKVIDPKGPKPSTATTKVKSGKAAIARLANNDDLNVATIAREAKKATEIPPDDEVVISLR